MRFRNFEITRREVLASIPVIILMLLIGLLTSSKVTEARMDRNEKYNKALQIEEPEIFRYGIDTDAGNAFVYGKLAAVDTVSYPELDGKYMYVKKVKEVYTRHTRTVTYTDGNGHTRTRIEVYWSWDCAGKEELRCQEVTFCGSLFESLKINLPEADYITTLKESHRVRYKYYGTATEYTGTVFTELKSGTISDHTEFYPNRTIQETVKALESGIGSVMFWVFWVVLIIAVVYRFYYLDNKWLE